MRSTRKKGTKRKRKRKRRVEGGFLQLLECTGPFLETIGQTTTEKSRNIWKVSGTSLPVS